MNKLKIKMPLLIILCLIIGSSKYAEKGNKNSALNYSDERLWYSDGEDIQHDVDVFYVTPTCVWDWKDSIRNLCNHMDPYNAKQRRSVDGSNRLAKALFSKSCNFYSPYYRQITMNSWMQSNEEIHKRYELAYQDVATAFEYYMKYKNNGRPFILAGHSQGAKTIIELLKHKVNNLQYKNLVAAYVFGFEVNRQDLESSKLLKAAQDSIDCGVVVSYNSVSKVSAIAPLFKGNVLCINPLNWKTDTTYASPAENLGSVFFDKHGVADTLFHKVGARIDPRAKVLIIDGLSDGDYYIQSIEQLFPKGNYHVQELNLYFLNIQKNIKQRIENFKRKAMAVK